MHAHALPFGRRSEQLGPLLHQADLEQMRAQHGRELLVSERLPVGRNEHRRIDLDVESVAIAVHGEGRSNTGPEHPCSRILGLVLVEPHRTALEVELSPCERERFTLAHAFTRKKPPEQAVGQRHCGAREQSPLLVGIEICERLSLGRRWQKAARQRTTVDVLERIDRDREQPREQRAEPLPRCNGELLGQPTHDGFAKLERDAIDRQRAEHGVGIQSEARLVGARAALHLDLIGVLARELT